MFTLFLGLVLLAIPFLLVELFSDKKRGFIYVLFFVLLFQTVLAISTQSLGVFYYNVIFYATLLADVAVVVAYFAVRIKNGQKFSFGFKNIDWIIIAVAAIAFLSLYQVNYNYTGKINIATDLTVSYHQVKNMVYPYPYFSDEWYAVSLVKGAISNHSLPVKNILDNSFFLNLELFFHSFIAEIMLLLGLNPLTQYTILTIFFNSLIILLIYLFLRISKIPKLTAGVCSLLALYITCGGNLPGLWQLIPFNFGIIFFLLSLCFMEIGDSKTVFLSVASASIFYPPLVPFYFIGLIVFLFSKMPKKHLLRTVFFGILSLIIISTFFYISVLKSSLKYIVSRIFFITPVAPLIPQFYFYDIIPLLAILLAIFGVFNLYKSKKWVLLSELILGVVFWAFYSFTVFRFFAEYERVVIFSSIIVVIISGFGLLRLEGYIRMKFETFGEKIIKITEVAILFIFLLSVPFYTQGENWAKLVEVNPANGDIAYPKSPVNQYLTTDDLKIFKNINGKRFLSLPWKGTVIGVATGNYPVLIKQGTLVIGSNDMLIDFLRADCPGKNNIAKQFNLDYIYIYEFSCPNFEKIDQSDEGLTLYKVKK